ncbi:MAG: acetone carboxylase subunit gamma [Candidatus Binatia bacterium]
MRMTDYLTIVDRQGKQVIECRCGYSICASEKNFKEHALLIESPVNKIGPLADISGRATQFVFREFCCPSCATLLTTEFALKDEPILHDIELKPKLPEAR